MTTSLSRWPGNTGVRASEATSGNCCRKAEVATSMRRRMRISKTKEPTGRGAGGASPARAGGVTDMSWTYLETFPRGDCSNSRRGTSHMATTCTCE
eukprot:scaffold254959_cov27-Tisochrysis_lutea.AAC.5